MWSIIINQNIASQQKIICYQVSRIISYHIHETYSQISILQNQENNILCLTLFNSFCRINGTSNNETIFCATLIESKPITIFFWGICIVCIKTASMDHKNSFFL